jgi:hypothetical protein
MKKSITDIYDSWIVLRRALWKKVIKTTVGYEIWSILSLFPQLGFYFGPSTIPTASWSSNFPAGTTSEAEPFRRYHHVFHVPQ